MILDWRKMIMLRVYISADYAEDSGDREVVDVLNAWGADDCHKVDFVDTAKVSSGSVSKVPDCRICDLKAEFNSQINASSYVIVVVGDKTAQRTAGSSCRRPYDGMWCECTPYKQNTNGKLFCKMFFEPSSNGDVEIINSYSYLQHEFEQAKKRNKNIIVVYNSIYKQPSWLPLYMADYKDVAEPFWIKGTLGNKVGNYAFIKKALGYK